MEKIVHEAIDSYKMLKFNTFSFFYTKKVFSYYVTFVSDFV